MEKNMETIPWCIDDVPIKHGTLKNKKQTSMFHDIFKHLPTHPNGNDSHRSQRNSKTNQGQRHAPCFFSTSALLYLICSVFPKKAQLQAPDWSSHGGTYYATLLSGYRCRPGGPIIQSPRSPFVLPVCAGQPWVEHHLRSPPSRCLTAWCRRKSVCHPGELQCLENGRLCWALSLWTYLRPPSYVIGSKPY